MKSRVAAALLLSLTLAAPPIQATQTSLIDFTLEDHAKRVHLPGEWQNRRVVLFLADRKGSEFNSGYAWTAQLVAHIQNNAPAGTAIVSIADLRGTPALARRFLRGMFKPDARDPVGMTLLDWQGQLSRAYALSPETFHMLVFDAEHALVYRIGLRTYDAAQLDTIKVALTSAGVFR